MFRIPFYVVVSCFAFAILRPHQESLNAYSSVSNFENGDAGRVLLLTAHPDDECMFFAPTITALVTREPNGLQIESSRWNTVLYTLCLSVGDGDGLGHIRRDEVGRSLDVLGIPRNHRWVVDHPYVFIAFERYAFQSLSSPGT